MMNLINVLQKVFSKEFYRLNTMFFLLVCGLAFGFMSGVEHKALAIFITSTPITTLIPAVLWMAYALKILNFNNQIVNMKENSFIHSLSLAPPMKQFLCIFLVVINQFTPAIGYGFFIILIGIKNHKFLEAGCIAGILIAQSFILTLSLYLRIGKVLSETKISLLKTWMDVNFEKSIIRIFIEWLIRNHTGMILVTKIFSCVIIFAVCQLYKYDTYDYRLLALGSLVSFTANLIITHHYIVFESHGFPILRSLPVRTMNRLIHYVLVMSFLLLPECIILLRSYPEQLSILYYFEILILGISLFLAGNTALLLLNNDLSLFSGRIFIAFMIIMIAILFNTPLLMIAGLFGIASVWLFPGSYYGFEAGQKSEARSQKLEFRS